MTSPKKTPVDTNTAYQLAAAALRARQAANPEPLDGEIFPHEGKFCVVLSQAIAPERLMALLGPSVIDIPEFRSFRFEAGATVLKSRQS